MLRALISTAQRWLDKWSRSLSSDHAPGEHASRDGAPRNGALLPEVVGPPATASYKRLTRVLVTDAVCRTMFDEFAVHRAGDRGDEEIGWVLLGVREETEAIALATLPAGVQRSAGVAHVRFNSEAQGLASRIVRQADKRLMMLGVVHTHPGSLRHPSDGDFRGDSLWVGQLRGCEGVFGIGTADVERGRSQPVLQQPESHRQMLGALCFSWYALGRGDRSYRKLPVELTLGPDLARPLHSIWETLEQHAAPLERLCEQQARVTFAIAGKSLTVNLPLQGRGNCLRMAITEEEVRYFVEQDGMISAVDPEEEPLDRAVYLILSELARPSVFSKGREVTHGFSTP